MEGTGVASSSLFSTTRTAPPRAAASVFPGGGDVSKRRQPGIRRIKRSADRAARSAARSRASSPARSSPKVAAKKLSRADQIREKEADRERQYLADHPDASREQLQDWRDARERAMHPVPALREETDFRHAGWWNRRQKIRAALAAAGYTGARLDRFDACGAQASVWIHEETGDYKIRATYCHDRWCQPCARARALQIADNVRDKIEGEHYLHIVLTLKHSALPLANQVDRLYRSFKKLRGHTTWRNAVDGGAAFLQTHVSKNDGLWHTHLHIVGRGRWLKNEELRTAWHHITGDSFDVDVTAVEGAAAASREISRYASKPVDGFTVNDPDALAEIMRAVAGRHLCFTFGKWRGHKLTARRAPEDPGAWRPAGSLAYWIHLAATGNTHAAHVLQLLGRKATPATGPPHLFYQAERHELGTPTP